MKITILTITYNQLDKLKILYESILKQAKYVKEWIVYDDNSTDGTLDWLKSISGAVQPRIIQGIKREKPLVVANMNECIRAMGDGVFMLVFADTYLDKDALKNLSETYIPNSFGSAFKINVTEDGQIISYHYQNIEDRVVNMMMTPHPWDQFSGNGMIATKEIMEAIGYKDENYGGYGIDDYDTALEAMMNGYLLFLYGNVKIYHIDHPTKNSTEENVQRLRKKISGEGYSL